jgi:thiol-disulfide isomerase/thioredoxin
LFKPNAGIFPEVTMLRLLIPCCLLLALCGCNNATMAPPKAPTTAALPPEGVPVSAAAEVSEKPVSTKAAGGRAAAPADEGDSEKPGKAVVSNKPADKDADNDSDDADDEEKDPKDPKVIAKKAAFAAAEKAMQKRNVAGAIAALEKGLADSPDDLDLLFTLAQLTMSTAKDEKGKVDYSKYQKAAEYFRAGLKAHPELNDNPGVRQFASRIYYNEACALAMDKKPAEALAILREAATAGFKDLALMEKDSDLESVRELPEFGEFVEQAKAARREEVKKEVDELFAATKPFDFNFELTDIEGDAIAKADFKGKVLIVDVWGTWCPPCRMEIPHFVELTKKYGEAGLAIVGLNSEGGSEEKSLKVVKEFHKENGMNYRCALIQRDTIDQIPDMEGFPTTLFFDRAGKLRAKVVGYHDFETLEAFVTRLLEEKTEADAGA